MRSEKGENKEIMERKGDNKRNGQQKIGRNV